MTPQEVKIYLDSFINYENFLEKVSSLEFRLERMKELLRRLGQPQSGLRIVHTAGSKGKGSTCAMIAEIVARAGYRVGLYTSPHFNHIRERIRLLDIKKEISMDEDLTRGEEIFSDAISEEELEQVLEEIRPVLDSMRNTYEFGRLTFFELWTALALYYFNQQKTDVVVLETGLGGRLDATNAVKTDICVMTPLSLEHTNILGDTLTKIAIEKAAIIKDQNQKVVITTQEKEVAEIFRARCREFGIMPLETEKTFDARFIRQDLNGQVIRVRSLQEDYGELFLNLLGQHQVENSLGALAAVECLKESGLRIRPDAILKGLANVTWPGRFEIFNVRCLTILDGAHNQSSAKALVNTFREIWPQRRFNLVLGLSIDKDKKAIAYELNKSAQNIVLTKAAHPRAADLTVDEFKEFFAGKICWHASSMEEALRRIYEISREEDIVLITGSLFVVSEARRLLLNKKEHYVSI